MNSQAMSEETTDQSTEKASPLRRFTEVIVSIAAFSIAIGELDGTVQTVERYYETFVSEYTDKYDYEKLEKIHVGNTIYHLEKLFKKPTVTKDIKIEDKQYNVYYYYQEKYLLTVFFLKKRMVAYTVINFKDDFHPRVNPIENKNLGEFSFSETQGIVDYILDASAAITSFTQMHEYGRQGFFRKYYYAYIDYGANSVSNKKALALISDTVELEVMGDEAFESKFAQLQKVFRPNMYGIGEVELPAIRKSLMSKLEFESYFGQEATHGP